MEVMPRKRQEFSQLPPPERIISKTFNKLKFSTDYTIRQIVDWGRESGRYQHEGQVVDDAIEHYKEYLVTKAGVTLRKLAEGSYRTRPKQKQ